MTIGEFLLKLASEQDTLSRFAADAEGAMREAGLDERHIQFLLSADLDTLRVTLQGEFEVSGEKTVIETVCIVTICAPKPPPPSPSDPKPDS